MDPTAIMQEYVQLIPNVFRDFQQLAADAPLSHLQLHVIDALSAAGQPLALKALRQQVQTSRQQLNAVVNALVAAGLIERRPNPDDGRSMRVALTPAGQALNQQRWQTVAERTQKQLLTLDDDQQLELYYCLHKLNRLLPAMKAHAHEEA